METPARRGLILWTIAFLLTCAVAVFQRLTGPTYPVSGSLRVVHTDVAYHLKRSHEGQTDHPVRIVVPDTTVGGILEWKRLRADQEWNRITMIREAELLIAPLPAQPAAGQLLYRIVLHAGEVTAEIPPSGPVTIRFKGEVPLWILLPHIVVMFLAMLLSTRARLEGFSSSPGPRRFVPWILAALALGGFVLGPLLQKYAFDLWWTGWPFGSDITDNKTLIAFLVWVGAAVALKKARHPVRWAIGAAIVTLLVYLIPHSLFGTGLDYATMQKM